jgi:AcrR family transcriptional regulator
MSARIDVRRQGARAAIGTQNAKPLRRDAELNLARILLAAQEVFGEHGYEASMEQVAARAEVGVGTLYRRFPTKADLCTAVVDAATDRTCQIACEVLAEVAPGDAVFEFARRCVDAPSSWRAATSRRPWSGGGADRALNALIPLIWPILEASQRVGTIRSDIVPTDLVITLMSVRAISDLCDADAPGTSRRFLQIALDGLRPEHKTPDQPPMSVKQLGRVLTER